MLDLFYNPVLNSVEVFVNFRYSLLQDITAKWSEVRQLVPQRDGTLQQELRKQQNNELMRRQFAEKANSVGPWIERQMDSVVSIAMGMQVYKKNIKYHKYHINNIKYHIFLLVNIFVFIFFYPRITDVYQFNLFLGFLGRSAGAFERI